MSTVDCSRYQGVLSVAVLQAWKAAGVTRVILKAGGGDSGRYQDSQWVTNSGNVRTAGLILEAYWFNGTTDPAGDAAFVLSFVPAGIRIWADVESEGSMAHWSDDQADTFETAVVAARHPSGTYMSASVTFGSWPKCVRRPLWVAAYGGSSVPTVGNWTAPVLWQYTSSGHLPGYSGNLDLDQDQAGLTALDATPIEQGALMALSDTEQAELLTKTRAVYDALFKDAAVKVGAHNPSVGGVLVNDSVEQDALFQVAGVNGATRDGIFEFQKNAAADIAAIKVALKIQ